MKKFTLKTLLVAAGLLMGGSSAWADTTTLLEYGTNDTPWTSEGLATWTGKDCSIIDDSYVQYTGSDNSDFATTKTISPTSGTIINLTAVWRGRSNTGRYWSENAGIYFRFGNIVVAQNDQDQTHGYVFTGLSNMSSVTTFTAGGYRTDIANCTWLLIEAEINTANNTLTSFSIKSEDGNTTYVSQSNVTLSDPDYTTVAFGFLRGGSRHNSEKQEQLKSVKITETTQSVSYAAYTVHFVDGDGVAVKDDVVRSGEVGSTVNANDDDKTKFFSGDYKYVYNNDGDGVEVSGDGSSELTVTYDKYGKYSYTVNAIDGSSNVLKTLASGSYYRDESVSYTYPRYINVNGTLYQSHNQGSPYKSSFTLDTDAKVLTTTYSATAKTSVIFYTEGESINGVSTTTSGYNIPDRASGAAVATGSSVKIVTLPAGTYQFGVGLYSKSSSGNAGVTLSFGDNSIEIDGGKFANLAEQSLTEEYIVDSDTELSFTTTGNGLLDYIYIIGTPTNTIVGTLDNTTGYMAATSDKVTLKPGESYHYQFNNYNTSNNGSWNNFILAAYDTEDEVKVAVRADNFEVVKWTNAGCSNDFDWTDFVSKMNGATVDMTVNYSADNVFSMNATITTNEATPATWTYTYTSNYTNSDISLTGDIKIALSVDHSWLEILSVEQTFISATIGTAGYSTFASTYPLDLANLPDGLTAWYIKADGVHDGYATLTEATSAISAGEGIILKGTADATYSIPVAASGTDLTGNKLVGVTGEAETLTASGESQKYVLVGNELQCVNGSNDATIPVGKAYLDLTDMSAKSRLSLVFPDDASAIKTIAVESAENGAIYNLSGQRVNAAYKGIIIKNGKKYLNK